MVINMAFAFAEAIFWSDAIRMEKRSRKENAAGNYIYRYNYNGRKKGSSLSNKERGEQE